MTVYCYPQPGKRRSLEVLQAFAQGCGGRIATEPYGLGYAPSAFYGVVGIESLFHYATRAGDWYYGDNAFFDRFRGRFFRFAKNELQLSRLAPGDPARLKALGVEVKPWQKGGRHIVVVEQSEHFLRLAGAHKWLERTLWELKRHTERPLRIRAWRRDKDKAAASLAADLAGAHALVTHMSGAAVEALINGVPAFCTGPCAAAPMASAYLEMIEFPHYPHNREEWAAGLAARQWTLDELRTGMAWGALAEQKRNV